jgi:hypothetical protein
MPPRSLSDRSPVSVARWRDDYGSSSTSHVKTSRSPLSSKSLTFGDANEVFHVDHLDDISDEQILATWYNANEYSQIKSSYQTTIYMMETGIAMKDDEQTSRGLEYRTQDGAWARYEKKRDAYNAVLDEQDRQWKVDKDDDEAIRSIYLEHSTKCGDAAHMRAVDDEKVARKHLRSIMPKKKDVNSKKTLRRSASVDPEKESSRRANSGLNEPRKSSKSSARRASAVVV